MWKLLAKTALAKPRTIAAPPVAEDDFAALGERFKARGAGKARAQPLDPRGRCRLVPRLRAGDSRA